VPTEAKTTPELSDARQALLQRYRRGGMARRHTNATAIPRRKASGAAPLSYGQQQVYLHSQLAGKFLIYNEPVTIHRYGELDVAALERSFAEIVRRHEAWRTTFDWDGDQPVQIVQPPPSRIDIPFTDLRAFSDSEREREAIRLATEDALQPFDLARGPMYRPRLVRLSETEHRLFLTLHHIIFDGVSLYRVFLPALQTLYEAFLRNGPARLDDLPIQYPDYAVWHREWIKSILPTELPYWKKIFEDLPELELKTDHPRPPVQTFAGEMETLHISAPITQALKALGQAQGATLFNTVVAAFNALLYGYTGQEDIVIGSVNDGRTHTETHGLLGFFLNTVVLRIRFSRDLPFTELVARVKDTTLGALAHGAVPFELLVHEFQSERDPARGPLFQVLISVEPPLSPLSDGWGFTQMDVETGAAKFDLHLELDERADGLIGRFIYNTDLFERKTIQLLKSRWLKLLDRIALTPNERICDLTAAVWREMEFPAPAQRKVPAQWNGMRTSYPRDAAIQSVLEEQVQRTPTAVAVEFLGERLTYDELNRRANQLARRLQKLGVARDVPVGVFMERSSELLIAILAILKAGGAYVPLDPSYPAERIGLMIEDTGMPLILTRAGGQISTTKKLLSVDAGAFTNGDDTNLASATSAEDLAYIMYTSGSTGVPKGVAVPHRAVVRLVKKTNYASFSPSETFLLLAPISFDASTFEIWGALLNGGKLVVMPPAPPTLEEIGHTLREHSITTLWLTSGLFNAMVDERLQDLRPLRQLLAGGDVLSVAHVRRALAALPNMRLINGYGPTESTTFSCCHTIDRAAPLDESIPIGKPIANTTASILDLQLQPVEVGATGELFIGGDGLARDYWRRPELTAAKFVTNELGERLYQTGDLARWRDDGTIEFLGRSDAQIKLRGFRIEPGEIENAFRQQPDVRDAAVIVREDAPGEKKLVAYVVGSSSQTALLAALKKTLPEYMVPSAIVLLDALPRTANGKLNRNALPAPSATPIQPIVAPQTLLEQKLARLWAGVLGIEHIGTRDNFFDLGGHSLLGMRLVNQLRDALGEHLSLVIVFEAPTVADMARLLETDHTAAVRRWIETTP